MKTPVQQRRAVLGLLLTAAAWPGYGQTHGEIDEQADKQADEQADEQAEEHAEEHVDEPANETATIHAKPGDWWFYLENDRVQEIQALLKDGADPNLATASGQPSLQRAVERDAWRVFDVLANDPRININIENPAGETPLMYLAVVGQTARAHTLIRRGARVNKLGWTPLHYAASRAQLAVARLLLSAGAMPNAPSPQGRTPLMMAAYSGSAEMVQLLLAAGADPTTRDANGTDAADWARQRNEQALADELRRVINDRLEHREALRRKVLPGGDIVDVEVFEVR